ncbi:ribosomal protein S18-alanine N-acetyltransferase [Gammaproteobacteria bacterium]|nr:ribosomal protein S18-alanine N-acetyltransferase [Gammaproteobacteria bacterium]MDA9902692.1 ribosomal protein S18-alanine N-acetyltransferase [Gammaproteobacteria bacterium]MDB4848753.1 ribosomal protein S18-alanine N-acetyltransferase [Gammaproteobacteria bacterium]MDC0401436.1 ribosomal protein S18-alanine N-acetyltransferase [Gammaproteobacteria bacterium]MDC0402391.1 ribosomal protein S18-alanine N-acetyltransferase [Gammaproteobacteria bacterium]
MSIDDLKEAYKIECEVNPSPWKYETFLSSFEVGHKGLICKHDSEIIGFIIFSPINPEAHILSISVTKKIQSKGVGSLLLQSMLDQCAAMNYKKIFLEVRTSNLQAINFYQKFGFSKDAIRDNYYSDNSEDALLMSLSI